MTMPKEASIVELLQHLSTELQKKDGDIGLQSFAEARPVLPLSLRTQSNIAAGPTTLPSQGLKLDSTLKLLLEKIAPNLPLSSLSPNYYGFIIGGTTPAALTADWLVSILDQNLTVHLPRESIATTIEATTLNFLVDLFHLPRPAWSIGTSSPGGGTFTTGATASNVLGLALGREFVIRSAIRRHHPSAQDTSVGSLGLLRAMSLTGATHLQILSTLPHSSLAKAASVVGIGRSNIISIASPTNPLEISLNLLEHHARDPATLSILAISAGEVNTGGFATTSLQVMTQIRQICDKYGIWIHVDGAFGLFARLFIDPHDPHKSISPSYSTLTSGVQGLDLADSITGDAHKLLNAPYDCGFFFTRHKDLSVDVFSNGNAAYLTSGVGPGEDHIQSPMNIGLENSRRFRALPVYASLLAYGRDGYVEMLGRMVELARKVVRYLLGNEKFVVLPEQGGRSEPSEPSEPHTQTEPNGHSEVGGPSEPGEQAAAGEHTSPPTQDKNPEEVVDSTFMIVLFRAKDPVLNAHLVQKIKDTGKIYVTGTTWDGAPAARIAVSNWRVDVERDFRRIRGVLEDVSR